MRGAALLLAALWVGGVRAEGLPEGAFGFQARWSTIINPVAIGT